MAVMYQNTAAPARTINDDSDVEEEALVAEYKEQVQYEDGEELSQTTSLTMAQQPDDIQARLVQAAQPLDFSAPLEVKFQSYDSYCSLFHFILNSEGPVELEPPSVRIPTNPNYSRSSSQSKLTARSRSTTGLGMSLTSSSINSTPSPHIDQESPAKRPTRRKSKFSKRTPTHGAPTASSMCCTR
jgi:hypothetical protein